MSLNVSLGGGGRVERESPAMWFRCSYSHHVFNQVSGQRLNFAFYRGCGVPGMGLDMGFSAGCPPGPRP